MILAVEPQCRGFEHARFNAGLLATAAMAFPDENLAFLCEYSHGRQVQEAITRGGHRTGQIVAENFEPPQPANAWARLRAEEMLCTEVLDTARIQNASAVVFCSVTSYTIIALKRLLARHRYRGPVIAIPHAVLAGIERRSRRFWNRPIDIVAALRIPAPPNLQLVALSRTILNMVQYRFPANNWRHLDHPYLFYAGTTLKEPRQRPLKIGIFGVLRHRLNDYARVIRAVQSRTAKVVFELAGHLAARSASASQLADCLPGISFTPLPASVYDDVAPTVDYALNISEPDYHRYAASTTLLDSFNFLVPVLSLDNALFDEYQAFMGDIGESFSSPETLVEAIGRIESEFPCRRYQSQQETIGRERIRFSPEHLVKRLKESVKR